MDQSETTEANRVSCCDSLRVSADLTGEGVPMTSTLNGCVLSGLTRGEGGGVSAEVACLGGVVLSLY